jgi:PAS domain S-box-containing protein
MKDSSSMIDRMISHVGHLILDSIPIAIVTMDTEFKITYFNNPAEDLTGYSATEALGKACAEILNIRRCKSECPLQELQECGEAATGIESEIVNRYEEHIPVRISVSTIKDHEQAHIGYLEVVEDVSREKALEREERNFQFMLAHDMKSPLVAILGLTRRIREHHDDMSGEELEQYCRTIKGSGEQLEAQVVEFLEYSRQVSDKITLSLEYADLPELMDQIALRHQQQAAAKRLTIRMEHESITPVKIDSSQLQRVFENLLNNAIKFTQQDGEIVISIKETSREVIIQFKDNGPGIAPSELPYIFDAFHQGKSSSTGHGLGLAAAKAIVQEHGGRVAVKSNPEEGSLFTVRIPKLQ